MGKYEEALERARKGMSIDEIFPELKGSEDERIRKWLIEEIKATHDYDSPTSRKCVDDALAYLERQKEPLTPEEKMNHPLYLEGFDVGRQVGEVVKKPAKWNDADDKIQRNLMSLLSCMRGDRIAEATYKKYYPWLRDLPKRFSFQKSAEWSEEDERMRNNTILSLQSLLDEAINDDFIKGVKNEISWLKSLRPQPHWKPSEEQIGALERAIVKMHTTNDIGILAELRDNLKKL